MNLEKIILELNYVKDVRQSVFQKIKKGLQKQHIRERILILHYFNACP